jgi:hypothetical protein
MLSECPNVKSKVYQPWTVRNILLAGPTPSSALSDTFTRKREKEKVEKAPLAPQAGEGE